MTNVMLVDQNYLFQKAFSKIISSIPECSLTRIVTAKHEVRQSIETDRPQVVFLDVTVGGEDTFILCQNLKERYPDTHVYMLSSDCNLNYLKEAMAAGVDECLLKPVSSKKITAILKKNQEMDIVRDESAESLFSAVEDKDYKQSYAQTKEYVKLVFEEDDWKIRGEKLKKTAQDLFSYISGMAESQKRYYLEKYQLTKKVCQNRVLASHWLMQIVTEVFKQHCILKYSHMGRVFNYIDAHINEEITLSDLSDEAEISNGYLSRIFKKFYKNSIVDYIHLRKIQMAKFYMASSDMNISDISYLLGYSEAGYFCKIFKKYDSITPSVFYNHYIKNKAS